MKLRLVTIDDAAKGFLVASARSVEQLRASLDSVKVEMTPALRAEIAALSRTPPPATDRLEEALPSQ